MKIFRSTALNALLNGMSAVLLTMAFVFIRERMSFAHKRCMLTEQIVFLVLFLISYLTYHFHAGRTRFVNPHWFRRIYWTLLLTHTVLAVTIIPDH